MKTPTNLDILAHALAPLDTDRARAFRRVDKQFPILGAMVRDEAREAAVRSREAAVADILKRLSGQALTAEVLHAALGLAYVQGQRDFLAEQIERSRE